jgi:hypothetical protein
VVIIFNAEVTATGNLMIIGVALWVAAMAFLQLKNVRNVNA